MVVNIDVLSLFKNTGNSKCVMWAGTIKWEKSGCLVY